MSRVHFSECLTFKNFDERCVSSIGRNVDGFMNSRIIVELSSSILVDRFLGNTFDIPTGYRYQGCVLRRLVHRYVVRGKRTERIPGVESKDVCLGENCKNE